MKASAQEELAKITVDYLAGMIGFIDCENGIKHKDGMSEAYDRGYSECYAMERNKLKINGEAK